jgi:uncharacterized protein
MVSIGPDFRAGLREAVYRPFNPAGLKEALAIFVFLVVVNQIVLQGIFTAGIAALGASDLASFKAAVPRALLLALLPAGLLTVLLAWKLARRRGVDPRDVFALHFPSLGVFGWLAVIIGFHAVIFAIAFLLVRLLGVEDTGLIEQLMMRLVNDPFFPFMVVGIIIGGPLAEEFVFRGQVFAALSETRLGFVGSAVVTSALWAALHITQPLHFIGVIFLMGLALSWLLVRFGSLWLPIVCHSVWNALTTANLYIASSQ